MWCGFCQFWPSFKKLMWDFQCSTESKIHHQWLIVQAVFLDAIFWDMLLKMVKSGLEKQELSRFLDLGAKPSCAKGGGVARALTSPVKQLDKPATLVLCCYALRVSVLKSFWVFKFWCSFGGLWFCKLFTFMDIILGICF